jgi:hypothetical protein
MRLSQTAQSVAQANMLLSQPVLRAWSAVRGRTRVKKANQTVSYVPLARSQALMPLPARIVRQENMLLSQPVLRAWSAGRGRTRLKKANQTVSYVPLAHTQAFKAPSQSSRAQAAAQEHTLARELSSAWHAAQAISPIQEQHHALLVQTAGFRICRALPSAPLAARENIRVLEPKQAAPNVMIALRASTLRFKGQSPSTIAPAAQKVLIRIQDQTDASAVLLASI